MVLNTYEENKGVIFRSLQGVIKIKWCLSDLVSFMDMKCKTTQAWGRSFTGISAKNLVSSIVVVLRSRWMLALVTPSVSKPKGRGVI